MSIRTNPSKAVRSLLNHIKEVSDQNKQTIDDLLRRFEAVKKCSDDLLDRFLDLDCHRRIPENAREKDPVRSLLNHIKEVSDQNQQTIDDLLCRFEAVSKWNDDLLDRFLDLDRHRRIPENAREKEPSYSSSIQQKLKDIKDILEKHKIDNDDETKKKGDADPGQGRDLHQQRDEKRLRALSPLERWIVTNPSNPIVKSLRVSYDLLDTPTLKICLLFLALFPEKAVLKKKLVMYWWVSEGLVKDEAEGETVLYELQKHEFIKPYRIDKCPQVRKFQIHPWIRYMLIAVAIEQKLLRLDKEGKPCFDPTHSLRACLISWSTDFENEAPNSNREYYDVRTIYNVSGVSLEGKPETLARFKKLVVLQLGLWQVYVSPTDHIQLRGESLLLGLKTQKYLKYLSLRGIWRITELPNSIRDLGSLEILDLKACHKLETLPDDVSPLRRLTILDFSECFTLQSMPKGLDKLTSLRVLKGLIIGNSQRTPFRIEHLKKLNKLEQLGIYITRGPYLPRDLDKLKDFASNVKSLKISWGLVTREQEDEKSSTKKENQGPNLDLTFPPFLEELKLEGIPSFSRTQNWLKPSQLKNLKKLYIKGGKLSSLDHDDGADDDWKVETLLLKYTDKLEIEEDNVRKMFGRLKYVKKVRLEASRETTEYEWSSYEGSSSST